jgi:hypothetical protein
VGEGRGDQALSRHKHASWWCCCVRLFILIPSPLHPPSFLCQPQSKTGEVWWCGEGVRGSSPLQTQACLVVVLLCQTFHFDPLIPSPPSSLCKPQSNRGGVVVW